eukprot:CAMPEP_0178398428 /NCGR_PEP_ID=MMETSP0689_2-20121128/14767_1 /TAXON_ID=160604 /ORGANISM="Amphidinium massartii, Strain CS-259" /LENGTH=103 /DNA_ID=CAMNT_0020019189 /DNA_START=112 /DNA_END=423 /DNA_ORIENTATION=-
MKTTAAAAPAVTCLAMFSSPSIAASISDTGGTSSLSPSAWQATKASLKVAMGADATGTTAALQRLDLDFRDEAERAAARLSALTAKMLPAAARVMLEALASPA